MIRVDLPEHGTFVEFPDDTPEQEMQRVLAENFPAKKQEDGVAVRMLKASGRKYGGLVEGAAKAATELAAYPVGVISAAGQEAMRFLSRGKVNPEAYEKTKQGVIQDFTYQPRFQEEAQPIADVLLSPAQLIGTGIEKGVEQIPQEYQPAARMATDLALVGLPAAKVGLKGAVKQIKDPKQKAEFIRDVERESKATGKPVDEVVETKLAEADSIVANVEKPAVSVKSSDVKPAEKVAEIVDTPVETVTTGAVPKLSTETGAITLPEKTKLDRAWNDFKRFWEPLDTLPDAEAFKELRYKTMGGLDRIERLTTRVWERTKDLEPTAKRDLFTFLDGGMPLEDLPQSLRPLAQTLQTQNNLIGKMLVKRGLLDQAVFEKNKNQYVHYMYLKHELGDKASGISVGASGKLDLSQLKARKDLTREEQRALGLIEDVSVAQPVGMAKSLSDIQKFDMFSQMAAHPEYTFQPARVKVGDKIWGIGKAIEELEIQKKMAEQAPNSPEIKARLDVLQKAVDEASQWKGQIPDDFVQLPNSPHYGDLAGAFVRKEIARDIQPVITWSKTDSKFLNSVVDLSDKAMASFKVGKTALNLPTAARNVVSNFVQLNMSGIRFDQVPVYMAKAAKSMLDKDANYVQGLRNGLYKTNWAQGEIGEVLKTVKEMQGKSYPDVIGGLANIAKYYGKIDDFFKLAKFIEQTEKGVPVPKAAVEAQKWGMDYSVAHPAIKKARRFIMPFVSYQYKIAPLVAETLKKRPWVIAKYAAIPALMEEYARNNLNLTEEDFTKLRQMLPQFIKKNESYAMLPWKSPEGNVQWVNLEYFYPWQNFLAMGRDIKNRDAGEVVNDIGFGNPLLDIYSIVKGMKGDKPPKDPYTGRDVYNSLDSPTEKALKLSKWVYEKWAPSMATTGGAGGYTYRAITGEPDRYGKVVSPEQAAGRWVGFNIVSPTPIQAAKEKQARMFDLRTSLGRILKDPTASSEKKADAIKQYQESVKELYK